MPQFIVHMRRKIESNIKSVSLRKKKANIELALKAPKNVVSLSSWDILGQIFIHQTITNTKLMTSFYISDKKKVFSFAFQNAL